MRRGVLRTYMCTYHKEKELVTNEEGGIKDIHNQFFFLMVSTHVCP